MAEKFVYFDLGNVLVTFDPRIAAQRLADAAACNIDRVLETVFISDVQQRYESGRLTDDQYADEINRMLGSDLSTERVLEAISEIFQPNWPIMLALENLKARGIPMGILSNTCDAHWSWLMQRDWPMLHGWFQHHILSYRVQCMKPEQGIYQASEDQCGLVGSRIFFTDDRQENIQSAAGRGWITHHFSGVDGLMETLNEWLSE